MRGQIELRDGVATVVRREPDHFRLIVVDQDDDQREIEATSDSFEALIDLRHQLICLGYRMHRLESIAPLPRD